jgi:hypothetical protein
MCPSASAALRDGAIGRRSRSAVVVDIGGSHPDGVAGSPSRPSAHWGTGACGDLVLLLLLGGLFFLFVLLAGVVGLTP